MTREHRAAPETEGELWARAEGLAGESIERIAARVGVGVPPDLSRHKGWVGHLVERALGACAGSRAVPDFEALGIELKTLPVDLFGRPRESTFVCTITLAELLEVEWEASRVRHKLTRVLWVPVESSKHALLSGRRFGSPLLWSPDAEELSALRFDWEELAGLVAQRGLDAVTAHTGRCLQIRPKARDSRARRRGEDAEGVPLAVLPRGFYLRATFTQALVRRYFAVPLRLVGAEGSGARASFAGVRDLERPRD